MSDYGKPPQGGKATLTFAQLSVEAKATARDAWKAANPGKPNKTDLEIEQAITAAGEKFTKDGDPAPAA